MLSVQVLVAAMHQKDHSLLDKMKIQSDVIVGNQCDRNSIERFDYNGYTATYLNFAERGVGLNRNNALMRANADICLFADDDMVYVDGYADIVANAYKMLPNADVIIFNALESRDGELLHDCVKKTRRVGRKGVSAYGTFLISAKTNSLKKKNIVFHRMFGGGAEYSHGEDTLFLQDCVSKGLRVYTCKETIGTVYHSESTWFKGYTDKYFTDKGVLFFHMYPVLAQPLCIYHVVKHRKKYKEYGLKKAIHQMITGCQRFNR